MRNKCWLLAVLAVLAGGWELQAQGLVGISVFGPPLPAWGRSGFSVYPPHSHNRSITIIGSFRLVSSVRTPLLHPAFPGPMVFGYPSPLVVVPAGGLWPSPVPRQVLVDDLDWQFDGRPIRAPRAEVLAPAQRPAAAAPALRPNRPDERREAAPAAAPPPRPRPLVPMQVKEPEPAKPIARPAVPVPAGERRQIDQAQQPFSVSSFSRSQCQTVPSSIPPCRRFLFPEPNDPVNVFWLAAEVLEPGHALSRPPSTSSRCELASARSFRYDAL